MGREAARLTLPIDALLPELIEKLGCAGSLVLKAPPGAGKTTRVPPAILNSPLMGEGQLLVIEPRRMAARGAARRMAAEQGERVGETYGYRVRFDEQVSSRTRVITMTEGILLRQLQHDPLLEGISGIVFDEFHERRLDSDLALAMSYRVQQQVRPDLKLVVMSATLDPEPVAAYLGGCPTLESPGRQFPVDIRYAGRPAKQQLAERIAQEVAAILSKTNGDVLVFLPGVGEIRQTERALQQRRLGDVTVMPLFGDQTAEEQDNVLAPISGRKVVLATNVAETSITIEGVTAVIDSGLARVMRFDPDVGLDRLQLEGISKASADQRAGRAGRTQPGVCVRLWDEASHRPRPEYDTPEVQRVDLSGAMLQLRVWGESDLRTFPWFESPDAAALEHAEQLLESLGAIRNGLVTGLGQQMARLPVQPRLARLIVEGVRQGDGTRHCLLAAMLSERSPFSRHEARSGRPQTWSTTHRVTRSRSDVLDRLSALEEFLAGGASDFPWGRISTQSARHIARVANQLERLTERNASKSSRDIEDDELICRSLLAAYPDRLARRRESGSPRGVMVGGKGVKLDTQSSVADAEYFLCVEIAGQSGDGLVRQASAVELDWLSPDGFKETEELFLHPTQQRVIARRRTYWQDLLIAEQPSEIQDEDAAANVLFEAARAKWDQVFPSQDEKVSGLLTRIRCLSEWMPELEFPACEQANLEELVRSLCDTYRSLGEIRKADWYSLLLSRLSYEQQQRLEREVPERLTVPSGSQLRLKYEVGRPPALEVRIQEVFGLKETPRVAGGRIPILLHLLAPNMRVQQVTDDLHSFWTTTYFEIRKELRRRYPKHSWPEDPTQAPPQRRPGKQK
ncbi:MAG: ATP-dependent helicase HrpB [Planctomycetaceae bacterium]|nr:ATP-dependent helicase HrpB [Planctomycetaceae bacterium]